LTQINFKKDIYSILLNFNLFTTDQKHQIKLLNIFRELNNNIKHKTEQEFY